MWCGARSGPDSRQKMPLVWAYIGHGAGTQAVNGTGSLLIRAERVGRDTMLSQIVRMVAEAQRSHVPLALATPMSIMVVLRSVYDERSGKLVRQVDPQMFAVGHRSPRPAQIAVYRKPLLEPGTGA